MRVLLSIKPEHAENIFNGSKRFEFRRAIFKKGEIETVVVYASSPVKKVIGEFEIDGIYKEDLTTLWNRTKKHAGIKEDFFYDYFINKDEGFAIKIKNARRYARPLDIRRHFKVSPPQSFIYL